MRGYKDQAEQSDGEILGVAVGKFNARSLQVTVESRDGKIIKDQNIMLGKKKLSSLYGQYFSNEIACKLRRYGKHTFDMPENDFIIRYELK